jgi:hypothetical protein
MGGMKIKMAGFAKMTCQNGKSCQTDTLTKSTVYRKTREKQHFWFFLGFGMGCALYTGIEER